MRLRIPQLLCRDCGKAVPFELPCLGRRSRVWLDVVHTVVKDYMQGHSYRGVARGVGQGIGLMTAWRFVQRVAEGPHAIPAPPELLAVGLDEVHNRAHGQSMWLLQVPFPRPNAERLTDKQSGDRLCAVFIPIRM